MTMPSASIDLEEIHNFATSLSVRAGEAIRANVLHRAEAGYRSGADTNDTLNVEDKDSSVDIVTDVDLYIERLIIDAIRESYPEHKILAEETYAAGGSKVFEVTDEPTWIVDPLDGTVNFTHMFPLVCVSIGFSLGKQAVVGAISAPLMGPLNPSASGGVGTLWSACQGRGAYQSYPDSSASDQTSLKWLEANCIASTASRTSSERKGKTTTARSLRLPLGNTRRLPANAPSGLLFASEWGKDRRTASGSNLNRKAATFFNMASAKDSDIRDGIKGGQVHGIRSLGSAALDLAYTAAGSIDCFWEGGCWEWDVCAGIAILKEAGGLVCDANPPAPNGKWWNEGPLPEASMGARRFLCVRACSGTDEEGPRQAQERVVREVWKRTDGLAYEREGVDYPS